MKATEYLEDNKYHLIINAVKEEWWNSNHIQPVKGITSYQACYKEREKDNLHYHCIITIDCPLTTLRSRLYTLYGLNKGQIVIKHLSTQDYLKKCVSYIRKDNNKIIDEIPEIEYETLTEETKKGSKKESIFKEWLKIKDTRTWNKTSIVEYIKTQYIERNKMFSDNVIISLTQNMLCIVNKEFNKQHTNYLTNLIDNRLNC